MSAPGAPRRSLLEPLLPAGAATRALVCGSACPERLRPASESAAGEVDLAIVAPGGSERDRAWLDRAIEECAARLGADGLVYVVVPRSLRRRAAARLRAAGLETGPAIAHLPNAAKSRRLVPLVPVAVRFLGPGRRVPRAVAAAVLRVGGDGVAALAPAVGQVARWPRARPLLEWLELDGEPAIGAVVTSTWRPGSARAVLEPYTRSGPAPVVVKLGADPRPGSPDEAERLAAVGDAARAAGARVPELVRRIDLGGLPGIVQTRLDGELAAPLLMRRPAELEPLAADLCSWLERWHRATARPAPLDAGQLERELLQPAEALAPAIPGGSEYLAALRDRCARARGATSPLVAVHNDLTTWNVLVDRRRGLGVIDWEEAEDAALPLKDFFYVIVDAAHAADGAGDRLAAARDCLAPGGRRADLTRGLQRRLADSLRLDPAVGELALHACWIGHAENEQRGAAEGDARPFLEIVRWLASTLGA